MKVISNHTPHATTVLQCFFRDHPGEPVPEANFCTLWCKGRLTEADTPTIRLGATSSGIPYFPDYKLHLNISRTPLFLPKMWEKFIDKSHLSISRTLFCYFLARRNVLGCIHVMRRSAKERQDAIDVVQKTTRGLNSVGKVCGDAVI